MPNEKPDFSGWATVYGRKCTDGRTIKKGAFDDMDGAKVPLVWQHLHVDPDNVIGYAILHADKQGRGMRADGYFNNSAKARSTREILEHGDIDSLSIYANQLTENNRKEVYHGTIKEVSVVMFGANADARIDYTSLHHSEMSLEELYSDAIIYNGVHFAHGDDDDSDDDTEMSDDEFVEGLSNMSDDDLDAFLDSLSDEELDALNDYLDAQDNSNGKLSHADESNDDFGIKSAQDLIDAYSALPENEMDLMNQFLVGMEKGDVSEDLVKKVASMIESKDKPTQVKLLTMLSIAKDNS